MKLFRKNFLKNLTLQLALYSEHENEYTISVINEVKEI